MPDRFVILHHRLDAGEHWDLMLEQGQILETWQFLRDPTDRTSFPMPARRIADHRLAYLTYEGPISRGRGSVRRVDAGIYSIERSEPASLVIRLNGILVQGGFVLTQSAGGADVVFDQSL